MTVNAATLLVIGLCLLAAATAMNLAQGDLAFHAMMVGGQARTNLILLRTGTVIFGIIGLVCVATSIVLFAKR